MIKNSFTYNYDKDTLTNEMKSFTITTNDNFNKYDFAFEDVMEYLSSNWIVSMADPEEFPLFGWSVYKLEEVSNNKESVYCYFNEYAIHDETEYLSSNGKISLTCLNIENN